MTMDQPRQAPKIDSKDLALITTFKDFYVVPDFQREYVWEDEHVERLFEDILDEFYDANGNLEKENEYFIGSIVTCHVPGGAYQLIDGQQRMTTIFLALCAIRDRLIGIGANVPSTLTDSIRAAVLDPRTGMETDSYRLVLQYEDSRDVLADIAGRVKKPDDIPATTESIGCLIAAYGAISEFLTEKFADDPAKLLQFYAAFVNRVKLIRIVTPNLSHALKVFETINDRGVGLTAVDLLKNLLFMRTPPEQHEKLKRRWKKLVNTLDKAKEKPLRFLRYHVMSTYDTDWQKPLREDQIYNWFSDNIKTTKIDTDPLGFVESLIAVSTVYANFLKAENAVEEPCHFLKNIRLIAGRAARQHFILLLAGQHLPAPLFDQLCQRIECLLFCYILTRESTKTFERDFTKWARRLRSVHTDDDLTSFLAETVEAALRERNGKFQFAFTELAMGRIQAYKLKYILAKLTQYVEQQAWKNPAYDSLDLYTNASVQVEHILPRNPLPKVREGFNGKDDYDYWVARLGNLTLLEKPINASISNVDFETKRPGYGQSQMLLTKALNQVPKVGKATSVEQAVEDFPTFTDWTTHSIETRHELLCSIARKVWMSDIELHANAKPG